MRKGEVRKQTILREAEKLFCEKGYLATTVDDILLALHCSKGSFYHCFDSKLSVLLELCRQNAQARFARYQQEEVFSTRDQFNRLLYWLQPFHKENGAYITLACSLWGREEYEAMDSVLRRTAREAFLPELQSLMRVLNETGAARVARPRLDDLCFEVYTALWDAVCAAVVRSARTGQPLYGPLTQIVDASRFLWERVLDLEPGFVEGIRVEEALPVLEQAAQRLRLAPVSA